MTIATRKRTNWREALKVLPVRYSEFNGNVAPEGGRFVTDGRMLFLRSKATKDDRMERLAETVQRAGLYGGNTTERRENEDTINSIWEKWSRPDAEVVYLQEIRERRRDRNNAVMWQKAKVERHFTTFFNAQYLRIASLVTDFDEIRQPGPKKAATILRGGEPVGLVMPLNPDNVRWAEGETLWPETDNA